MAYQDILDRYRILFELAWDNHGLVLNLNTIPNWVLPKLIEWRNHKVEEENERLEKIK